MIAGPLDRRIVLRRAVTRTNDFGEATQDWSDLAIVWAASMLVSNRELFAAQQVGAESVVRFQVRWSERICDLSPRDRLIAGNREYNITGVAMIGRDEGLDITAEFREPAA